MLGIRQPGGQVRLTGLWRRGVRICKGGADFFQGTFLVGFEAEHIVGSSFMDLCSDGHLGVHRVDGYGAAAQLQGGQQTWDGFNFMALFLAPHLAGAQAARIHPGSQQVHPVTTRLGIVGAAQGLAVNGHLQAFQGTALGAQDFNHRLGFDHDEDIAEDIVGRSTVLEGQKRRNQGS